MTFATCFSWLPSVVFGKHGRQRHVGVERLADVERLLRSSCWRRRPASTRCRSCAAASSDVRRATSSAAVPKPFSTSTWLSAVGAAAIDSGDRGLPAREDAARQRGDHREAGRWRWKAVGRAAAPSGLTDAIGDRRLPLRDLIGMREELIRPRRAALVVLPRQRLHQRADVADDRQLLLRPERLQLGQARMQAERAADAERRDRQQGVARESPGPTRCATAAYALYSVVLVGTTMLLPSLPPARKTQTSAR